MWFAAVTAAEVGSSVRLTASLACAQAGSDSLLTSSTFLKLTQTCFDGVAGMEKHVGVLYGLGSGAAGGTLCFQCACPRIQLHSSCSRC